MNSRPPPPSFGDSPIDGEPSLGLLFRQVRDALWARMQRELAALDHDLTFSQYVTIKKLALGVAGVTDLARAAELNPGAMTRLLDRLESKGLIVRANDPSDRRAWRIHLTETGQHVWRDMSLCAQRVRDQALDGLDEAERTQFFRLLEHARDNLTRPD